MHDSSSCKMGWFRCWLSVSVIWGFDQSIGGVLERFFWALMNLSSERVSVLENLSLTVILPVLKFGGNEWEH